MIEQFRGSQQQSIFEPNNKVIIQKSINVPKKRKKMAEANKDLFVGIFAEAFEQRQNKFSEVFIGLLLTGCIENTRQTLNEGKVFIKFNECSRFEVHGEFIRVHFKFDIY